MANEELTSTTDDLQQTLLGQLQLSFEGFYTHRLRQRLTKAGLHPGRKALIDGLLSAQREGLISFKDRRWGTPSAVDQEDESIGSLGSFKAPVPEPLQKVLRAIPAQALSVKPYTNWGGTSDQGSENSAQSWEAFQKLGDHYIECLRRGAASRTDSGADRHEQQFHLLKLNARWWPDETGTKPIRIAREHLGAKFLEGLSRRAKDPILIGYPISVTYIEANELFFITPMSILQCDFSLDDSALILTPISSAPTLNPQWVGKRGERRGFFSDQH